MTSRRTSAFQSSFEARPCRSETEIRLLVVFNPVDGLDGWGFLFKIFAFRAKKRLPAKPSTENR